MVDKIGNRERVAVAPWRQGEVVELTIDDLNDTGAGVGRWEGRAVFVADTVPGDRAIARLTRVKPQYATAKLEKLLHPSPQRVRPRCIVADKCGGCQWQHVSETCQHQAKRDRLIQAITRIGGFVNPPVAPVLAATDSLGYRNKATYPLATNADGKIQAGYYRQGTHQLVNLNQCPVQDARLNPLLAGLKREIQAAGWSIYQEKTHNGQLRHLSLRIGRRTGEILATLVSTEAELPGAEERARDWLQRYPGLVGVALNHNPGRTNAIFGPETRILAGCGELREVFAGLDFFLRPETFFQVNTEAAELLLGAIGDRWALRGDEFLLDAYCGIGTFTLPLAQRCGRALGIEVQAAAVEQARHNAERNAIANVEFSTGTVESQIARLTQIPDLVLLDPPRKGCDRAVIEALAEMHPPHIAWVSCKPATLARDLRLLRERADYQLIAVQPVDFFPQTTHIECVAFLELL